MVPWRSPATASTAVLYVFNTEVTATYSNYTSPEQRRRLEDIDALLAQLRELNRPWKGKYALRLPPVRELAPAPMPHVVRPVRQDGPQLAALARQVHTTKTP